MRRERESARAPRRRTACSRRARARYPERAAVVRPLLHRPARRSATANRVASTDSPCGSDDSAPCGRRHRCAASGMRPYRMPRLPPSVSAPRRPARRSAARASTGTLPRCFAGNLRARHVPASPAILDRRAMIDFPSLRVVVLVIRKRQHAHRQHARHAVGLRQQVALQAVGVAANELRLRPARLRYRVEVNALCGVQRRRFDRVCALRPRNGHRVVEINRSRCRLLMCARCRLFSENTSV